VHFCTGVGHFLRIDGAAPARQAHVDKEINMAVLVIADVEGQTPEKYDGMLANMAEPMRQAKGFICHLAGPADGSWRVIELWESKEDATKWFAEAVHPNLPPGVKPRRTFHDVHALVMR
jgi:hypothetical protein